MDTDDRITTYLTEQVLPTIAEHGWMIQGVFGTTNGFCYTVGLTAAGLPELVIAGLPFETAGAILNDAARRHCADELTADTAAWGIASVPFRVIHAPTAEVNMARNLYGNHRVSALQLLWPDAAGAFPDEPAWSLPADAQPIYR